MQECGFIRYDVCVRVEVSMGGGSDIVQLHLVARGLPLNNARDKSRTCICIAHFYSRIILIAVIPR